MDPLGADIAGGVWKICRVEILIFKPSYGLKVKGIMSKCRTVGELAMKWIGSEHLGIKMEECVQPTLLLLDLEVSLPNFPSKWAHFHS